MPPTKISRVLCALRQVNVSHGFYSKYTHRLLSHLAELARGLNWCDPVVHLKTCIETQSYDGPISTGTYTKTGVFEQAVGRLTERLPECAWLEAGHGSSAVQILRDFHGTSAEQQIVSLQLTTPNLMCLLSGLTADLCNSNYQFHSGGFQRAQKGYILLMLPPY